MGRAVERNMGAGAVARIGLFKGALRGLAMSTVIGAALTGLLLIVTHWEAIGTAIGNAIERVRDFFTEEGRQRRKREASLGRQETRVMELQLLASLGDAGDDIVGQDVKALLAEAEAGLGKAVAEHVRKYGPEAVDDIEVATPEGRQAVADALQVELDRMALEMKHGVREYRRDELRTNQQRAVARRTGGLKTMTADDRLEQAADMVRLQEGIKAHRGGREPEDLSALTPEQVAEKYGLDRPPPGTSAGTETGTMAGTQARVPPPQRIEVRNLDVVEAIHRQRSALVHELRQLGVTLRGGELPVAQPGPVAEGSAPVALPALLSGMEVPTGVVPAPVALPDLFRHVEALTAASVASQAGQAVGQTTTSTRTTNLGGVNVGGVTVNAAPGQDPAEVAEEVTDRIEGVFRDHLSELIEDSDARFVR